MFGSDSDDSGWVLLSFLGVPFTHCTYSQSLHWSVWFLKCFLFNPYCIESSGKIPQVAFVSLLNLSVVWTKTYLLSEKEGREGGEEPFSWRSSLCLLESPFMIVMLHEFSRNLACANKTSNTFCLASRIPSGVWVSMLYNISPYFLH